LPCPAPEPKMPSVSHLGFASSGPLRRTLFAPPTPLTLGCPLPWPWRGCEWPREQLIYLGWSMSGGAFQGCRCSRLARLAKSRERHPMLISQRLLLPPSAPRFSISGLGLTLPESETGQLGRNFFLPSHYDRPGNFTSFREDSQSKLHLQRFPRYESYGKISGRAYSSKLSLLDFIYIGTPGTPHSCPFPHKRPLGFSLMPL